ncbi:HAD-IIA family hydrolase [Candidatus Micrarchaeota archaeon]|nr:HAD-IIA family hydrolase [Candidatus Micrarchaeota archaeon]
MIKVIILDLDGTVYKGNQILPYVKAAVENLLGRGKKVIYLTNASMKTREEIKEKLIQMGLYSTKLGHIYSSGYGTARYIKCKFPHSTVYAITEGGLIQELEDQAIKISDGTEPSVDLVAVGIDSQLTYEKLKAGFRYIENGAKFIASNADKKYPLEEENVPGAGSIVSALEYSTGVKPFVIGKPSTYLLELISKELKVSKKEMLLIGDNLLTDILCAKKFGCKNIFILGGVHKKSDIKKLKIKPDKTIKNLGELALD